MAQGSGTAENLSLGSWSSGDQFRKVSRLEVEYSRGFLRCSPQQWFPGLAAQWLPLSHALVVDLKVVEVRTAMTLPTELNLKFGYQGILDGEQLALLLDDNASSVILDAVSPNGTDIANSIILEYIVRRILTSFALSWTASKASVFQFQGLVDPAVVQGEGAVKVNVQINNEICALWFMLGPRLVGRMDGLWRRQLLSRSKSGIGEGEYYIEVAQLGVPPTSVAQYVQEGTIIDLETPVSDQALLRRKDGQVVPVQMLAMETELAIEILQNAVAPTAVNSGTTRMSICLGRMTLDSSMAMELQQPGAMCNTGIYLDDNVQMIINTEVVAEAFLGVYQGRLALRVK